MQRIAIANATPGMRLVMPIYNERGEILLRSDMTLTPSYLSLLREKGCKDLWIYDEDTEDIQVTSILSETLRSYAVATIGAALIAGRVSVQAMGRGAIEERLKFVESSEFKKSLSAFPVDAVANVATRITDAVLNATNLTSLVATVRLEESYLHTHCLDTTITALVLGQRLGQDRKTLQRLAVASLLHDIGMVLIDPTILTKPGRLNEAQVSEMRQHTTLGFALLETVQGDRLANLVALQHHERQNGSGYPQGLVGARWMPPAGLKRKTSEMTFWAEIVAVADVYDALASDRPYRPAVPPEKLPLVLRSLAGAQLNADLVSSLLKLVPFYPPGTEVVVTAGPVAGCRGFVIKADRDQPLQPVIRLLYDRAGKRTRPMEIDLRKIRSIEIRSRPFLLSGTP